MLKMIVKCRGESERIYGILEQLFNDHAIKLCEHYVDNANNKTLPLCNNPKGDGVCCLSACPLEKETATKKAKGAKEPVLEHGHWLASFIDPVKVGKDEKVLRVIAGVYETAQEAYMHATKYGDKEFWKSPPDMLAIELLGHGIYPECLKCQIICPFVKGVGYMDVEGITRGSYMSRQGLATAVASNTEGIAVVVSKDNK